MSAFLPRKPRRADPALRTVVLVDGFGALGRGCAEHALGGTCEGVPAMAAE